MTLEQRPRQVLPAPDRRNGRGGSCAAPALDLNRKPTGQALDCKSSFNGFDSRPVLHACKASG